MSRYDAPSRMMWAALCGMALISTSRRARPGILRLTSFEESEGRINQDLRENAFANAWLCPSEALTGRHAFKLA